MARPCTQLPLTEEQKARAELFISTHMKEIRSTIFHTRVIPASVKRSHYDEIFSEAMRTAMKCAAEWDETKAPLLAYFRWVMKYNFVTILKVIMKNERFVPTGNEFGQFTNVPADTKLCGLDQMNRDVVQKLRKHLTPRENDLVDLYIYKGFRVTEIAKMKGCTHQNIRIQWKEMIRRVKILSKRFNLCEH